MKLSYIVGQPGAGKSTALANATSNYSRAARTKPFAHNLLVADGDYKVTAAELGATRPLFPGTDTLSMAVQPKVIDWLQTYPYKHIIGEGDRLATLGFLQAAQDLNYEVNLIWIDTPDDLANQRRTSRSSNQQSTVWLRGRISKVRNLVNAFPHTRIDGTLEAQDLADELKVHLGL